MTDGLRIGALFAGYGGLELAVQSVIGGHTAWTSEIDPGACKILDARFPGVPNLGDITAIDWATVPPVDILTGGFPCTDVSQAGLRTGLRPDTRSGLWTQMAYAIDRLRPRLVVIENVRGLLSAEAHRDVEPGEEGLGDGSDGLVLRALGAVLGDLAGLGFDAEWCGLRAADVGAPHGRFRVFIIAWPAQNANGTTGGERRLAAPDPAQGRWAWADACGRGGAPFGDAHGPGLEGRGPGASGGGERVVGSAGVGVGPGPASADSDSYGFEGVGWVDTIERDVDGCGGADIAWGVYEPAIRRDSRGQPRNTLLGGETNVCGGGMPEEGVGQEAVPYALQATARNGGSGREEAERPSAPPPCGSVLGESGEDGNVLAVDWGQGQQVRARIVHAPEAELQGTPVGIRESRGADPRGAYLGPPVSCSCMCESGTPGAGDSVGECPSTGCGADTLPVGASAERRQPVCGSADWAPAVPDLSTHARPEVQGTQGVDWGHYAAAIARWEAVLGRPAPAPTESGRSGPRLSARFVEFLMGLPAGWVVDVPGLSRSDQLKALGNGVVPQQAAAALRYLLTVGLEARPAAAVAGCQVGGDAGSLRALRYPLSRFPGVSREPGRFLACP